MRPRDFNDIKQWLKAFRRHPCGWTLRNLVLNACGLLPYLFLHQSPK
jgi:hypothetical protein